MNDSVLALSSLNQDTKITAMNFWQSNRKRNLYMGCSHFMSVLCFKEHSNPKKNSNLYSCHLKTFKGVSQRWFMTTLLNLSCPLPFLNISVLQKPSSLLAQNFLFDGSLSQSCYPVNSLSYHCVLPRKQPLAHYTSLPFSAPFTCGSSFPRSACGFCSLPLPLGVQRRETEAKQPDNFLW